MAILNYTTAVNAQKTVSEIHGLLSQKGARSITTDYDLGGQITGVSFIISIGHRTVHFRLPANWLGVKKALAKQTKVKKYLTDAHAMNVCWRIVFNWVQAQIAIIEAEQADIATVFLPYAVMTNQKTVSENFLSDEGDKFLLS